MNDPNIFVDTTKAILLLTIVVAFIGLAACATPYQPPGGGLSAVVQHEERARP